MCLYTNSLTHPRSFFWIFYLSSGLLMITMMIVLPINIIISPRAHLLDGFNMLMGDI